MLAFHISFYISLCLLQYEPGLKRTKPTNQIKQLWPGLCADVQQVFEALGDQESRSLAFPLQQSICGHRRAHSDPADE